MKFHITLFLTVSLSSWGISQNVELTKKLDNVIDIPGDYVNALGEYIRYEKVLGKKIMRLEEDKVQLYDQSFEKQWEVNLETVKSVGGDNYYYIASNENFIYIVQFGASFKSENVVSKLTQIDVNGTTKSIALSDQIELRGVGGMEVIDDNVHICYVYTTGAMNPYSKGLELYYSTIVLNPALEKVGDICAFSHHPVADEKFNYIWYYQGMVGENMEFKSYYFINEKGKHTSYYANENEQYEVKLTIDKSNKIVAEETRKMSELEKFAYGTFYYCPTKYNTEKYEIAFGAGDCGDLRPSGGKSNLRVSRADLRSQNIIASFFEMTELNTGAVRTFEGNSSKLIDIVEDPLNNNVNVILISEMGVRYLITLSESLNVKFIQEYKTNYKPYSFASTFNNFTNGFSELGNAWGTMPEGHIPNAFDFAMQLKDKCQFTVVNYDDYQVLFTDNKATGESHGYKIVK